MFMQRPENIGLDRIAALRSSMAAHQVDLNELLDLLEELLTAIHVAPKRKIGFCTRDEDQKEDR